jgi:hypothetical protein
MRKGKRERERGEVPAGGRGREVAGFGGDMGNFVPGVENLRNTQRKQKENQKKTKEKPKKTGRRKENRRPSPLRFYSLLLKLGRL